MRFVAELCKICRTSDMSSKATEKYWLNPYLRESSENVHREEEEYFEYYETWDRGEDK